MGINSQLTITDTQLSQEGRHLVSELSKTIGPVGRADGNLSGPIVSSKTSVQMTD